MKKKLRDEAWEVNNLLTDYIEIHDRLLKEAASFQSLFKKVDFEKLFHDSYDIFLMINGHYEHLLELKQEIFTQLTPDQQKYLNLLVEYVNALLNTTKFLSDNLFRILEAVEDRKNRKLVWKEFQENQKKYQDSISEYLRVGECLTKIEHVIS